MNEQQIDGYVNEVAKMTLVQLLVARAGWKQETAQWQVVDREITRRDARGTNFRAWLALAVSLMSLAVALLA